MKKKSLYDIAMEKKNSQNEEKDNIIIIRKKSILLIITEILGKILKLIVYIICSILLTIGATVIFNQQTREILVNIIQNFGSIL